MTKLKKDKSKIKKLEKKLNILYMLGEDKKAEKIKKKLKKLKRTYFLCNNCGGQGCISFNDGIGAFGESCWHYETCEYCNGKGKLTKKDIKENEEVKRINIEGEIKRLKDLLK